MKYIIFSKGIKYKEIQPFLDNEPSDSKIVLGWGNKPNTNKARAYAAKHNFPYWSLEDGFLRSIGLGVNGCQALSLVVDDLGIYYDSTRPSRLEKLIQDGSASQSLLADAKKALDLILQYKLSKYNHAEMIWPEHQFYDDKQSNILIIDQTFGDMALQYGFASAASFQQMFQTAQLENPKAQLWIKIHPDVLSGKKKGHLTALLQQPNVRLISEDINPLLLISKMDKVYTVTSQMGFEALLLGKPVVTFGVSWYAGWGLTDDRHNYVAELISSGRRGQQDLLTLFTAAYLLYASYINPNTGEKGTIFDVIDYLQQMRQRNDFLRGQLLVVAMSLWKRAVVRPFLQQPSAKIKFVSSLAKLKKLALPPQAKIVAWGNKSPQLQAWAQQQSIPYIAVEDGFIRSVGLGSNLVAPLSLVLDDQGIYFDATKLSRLETMLQQAEFSAEEIKQAAALTAALIAQHVGKYNVGSGGMDLPQPRPQQIILVPGQVENDASLRFGSPDIQHNLALLRRVRQENPTAFIVFKPHPDVVSGNRPGVLSTEDAMQYADLVVENVDILSCIAQADAVHTMTSLAGFEALLRKKQVVCYGLPFYAGWGLTIDKISLPRRTKRRSLAELVAATLLRYPYYCDPQTGRQIDAFRALELLAQQRKQQHNQAIRASFLAKQLNKIKHLWRTII